MKKKLSNDDKKRELRFLNVPGVYHNMNELNVIGPEGVPKHIKQSFQNIKARPKNIGICPADPRVH